MIETLHQAVSDVLNRLGDLRNKVWSRDEVALYVQDGYDLFCRETHCIFDRLALENVPPSGNWQTPFEKSLILQHSGWGFTDWRLNVSGDDLRQYGGGGPVAGSYALPTGSTNPEMASLLGDLDGNTSVPGGFLPDSVVELLRVTYDGRSLYALQSAEARRLDANYETRTGDPQFFTHDGDGLQFVRVIPRADGAAVYDTTEGSWGTLRQTTDSTVEVVTTEVSGRTTGGFGILRHRSDCYPSGGRRGTITRIHPEDHNMAVEVYRLGRPLSSHRFEIPTAYRKYVIFWAMARALRREGPGQDIKLADHFEERFNMGVQLLRRKRYRMDKERVGSIGASRKSDGFPIGDPQPPSPYGVPR